MKSRMISLIPSITANDAGRLNGFKRHFKGVELDLWGMPRSLDGNGKGKLRAILDMVRGSGMEIPSVHLRGFNLSSKDKKDVSEAVGCCRELQRIVGPRIAIVHPGAGDMDDLVENLSFLLERVPPELTIALENMGGKKSPLNSAGAISYFVDRVKSMPGNLGICIDTSHPDPEDGVPYTEVLLSYLDAAEPRLAHLHISDVKLQGGKQERHLRIGDGIVDWGALINRLHGLGYQNSAAVEVRSGGSEAEDIIISAKRFIDMAKKDLKNVRDSHPMARDKRVSRNEMVEKAREMHGLPDSLIPLLGLPDSASVEEGPRFTYYLVPSSSFSEDHEDPFYSLTGGKENLGWADFLFGFREDAGKLHVILIDKSRKIALEERIYNIYSGEQKYDWQRLKDAIGSSLEALSKHEGADHIEYTFGQPEIIKPSDPRAW